MSEYGDFEDCQTDAECIVYYHRSIRATNRRNPQRYECPTCGKANALSAHEKQSGYHCEDCTRATEGYGMGGDC